MAPRVLLLPLVAILLPLAAPLPLERASGLDRVRASSEDNWFWDRQGRVRLFHGVNIINKKFPWYCDFLLNDTRLDDLRSWGLNVVRLGAMWAGVEPKDGQINQTYVNILKTIVKKLEDRGIYTFLDMHQDGLTSRYQAYDGIPRWLADTFPPPTNPFPWPLTGIGAWEEKYLTQAVSEAFQHFYNNTSSSVDRWANFWGVLAKEFSGNQAILGYNLMNEPWIGDFYADLTRAFPGVAGKTNLLPAYDKINEKIRQHDKEGLIIYEPVIYGQVGHGRWMGSGFDRVPGGSTYQDRSAYSFHMYCWALEFLDADASDEKRREARDYCYKTMFPQIMDSAQRNVRLTGGAHILTEFGLCKTGNSTKIDVECSFFLNLYDEHLVSWVDWDYSDNWWYRGGVPVMEKVTPYVRPYAQAVAGVPTLMKFDEDSLHFKLAYTALTKVTAPTVIVLPKLRYPAGVDIKVTGPVKYQQKGDLLLVTYDSGTGSQQEAVVVEVKPKRK